MAIEKADAGEDVRYLGSARLLSTSRWWIDCGSSVYGLSGASGGMVAVYQLTRNAFKPKTKK